MARAWGGAGAWAQEAELADQEAKEREAQTYKAPGSVKEEAFPSLGESLTTKPKKKNKGVTVSLSELMVGRYVGPGGKQRSSYSDSTKLTTEELLSLPTGPRERADDEQPSGGLGGGFKDYGGFRGGANDRGGEPENRVMIGEVVTKRGTVEGGPPFVRAAHPAPRPAAPGLHSPGPGGKQRSSYCDSTKRTSKELLSLPTGPRVRGVGFNENGGFRGGANDRGGEREDLVTIGAVVTKRGTVEGGPPSVRAAHPAPRPAAPGLHSPGRGGKQRSSYCDSTKRTSKELLSLPTGPRVRAVGFNEIGGFRGGANDRGGEREDLVTIGAVVTKRGTVEGGPPSVRAAHPAPRPAAPGLHSPGPRSLATPVVRRGSSSRSSVEGDPAHFPRPPSAFKGAEIEATVVDGNGTETGDITGTTIGGRNGQPKQTISYSAEPPCIDGVRVQGLKEGQVHMDMDFKWGVDGDIVSCLLCLFSLRD